MRRHAPARQEGVFRALLLSSLALSGLSSAATAPYPKSGLITALSWDFTNMAAMRKAHGSDLWPLTWAADGNLYGA